MADLDDGDGLNERQRRFVELYMGAHGGNATQAYKGAYGEMSDNAAAANASRLVRTDKVRDAIAARMEADPQVMTRLEVVRRLTHIARGGDRARVELREDEHGAPVRVAFAGSRVGDELRACELLLKLQGAFAESQPSVPAMDSFRLFREAASLTSDEMRARLSVSE